MFEQNRFKLFKNEGKNQTEMRLRRVDDKVQLRKQKKEEQIFKRRNLGKEYYWCNIKYFNVNIHAIMGGFRSSEISDNLISCRTVHIGLYNVGNSFMEELIKEGLIPILLDFLYSDNNELQYLSTLIIANICAHTKEQMKPVVDDSGIYFLINIITCGNVDTSEEAMRALGNIAGECDHYRDLIISSSIMFPLREINLYEMNTSFLEILSPSNLFHARDLSPDFESINDLLPILYQLLNHNNFDIIKNVCYALENITWESKNIQTVLSSGIISPLINSLTFLDPKILLPALGTIENLVHGFFVHSRGVLSDEYFKYFLAFLHNENDQIKEKTIRIITCIAETPQYIQMLIDHQMIDPMINILENGSFKCQKAIVWAIDSIVDNGKTLQIQTLTRRNVILLLRKLLSYPDSEVMSLIINIINKLLDIFDNHEMKNEIYSSIEECGMLEVLESLLYSEYPAISYTARNIVKKYSLEKMDSFEFGQ